MVAGDQEQHALSLLYSCSVTRRYPEEVTNVVKSGVVAALAGFVYGGLPAARQARQRYIQISQAEIYTSRVDAVVGQNLCVDADVGK